MPSEAMAEGVSVDARASVDAAGPLPTLPRKRGRETRLPPPRRLLRRGQMAKTLHRRAHQEAVAFLDDALDIALLDVRVADDDIMLLAGVDDALHPFQHHLVLVLARIAELLRQVAFADQDATDARHIFEHGVEVLDAAGIFDLQDAEDFALRIERPYVGLLIIFLLAQAPVARRRGRAVAADAGRLVEACALEPRIAAGADRIGGFLHGRNMRKHDAVAAHVEGLLGLPLRHFDAVHRDADHRRHARNQ